MILSQIDEAINKALAQNLTPINFKILGSSNGIVISKIFEEKTMVFISAVIVNDRLGFELNVITLDSKWKNLPDGKPVYKVPLLYSGILAKHNIDKIADITNVEIQMQQCSEKSQNSSILAVKISITYRNNPKSMDKISLLVVNAEELRKAQIQNLHLLSIKCSEDHIQDLCWHPLSSLTLLVLTQSQNLQIWNLQDEDFIKPSHVVKLKNYKNSQYTSLNIKFTNFAIPTLETQPKDPNTQPVELTQINNHRYTLFLMNSLGDIISIFPFLPPGSQITRQQYDLIYTKEQQENRQIKALSLYLNNCEIQFLDESQKYLIVKIPSGQSHQSVQKWMTNAMITPKQAELAKISREKHFYKLQLYPIDNQNLLVIQILHRASLACNCVKVGLINRQIKIGSEKYFNRDDYDNVIYEIVEIRNSIDNPEKDFRLVSSDPSLNQEAITKYQSFYYTESNGLYKLDLSPIFKFISTNQLKFLQTQNSFSISLIFQLPPNQSILTLACDENVNSLFYVRRTKNKIKFENQSLTYLNTFSEVEQINRSSTELIAKLNTLKSQYTKPVKKQDNKNTSLNVGPGQLKIYEEKGIEQFKKDYQRYCDNLKNSIDHSMSKLKTNYEAMKKRLRNFSDFRNKRTQIDRLLQEVEENNEQINKILFEDKPAARSQPTGEVAELAFDIDSLNNVLDTAKGKKLILEDHHKKTMLNQIEQMFKRLKRVRKNIEQAQQNKKEYLDQVE